MSRIDVNLLRNCWEGQVTVELVGVILGMSETETHDTFLVSELLYIVSYSTLKLCKSLCCKSVFLYSYLYSPTEDNQCHEVS